MESEMESEMKKYDYSKFNCVYCKRAGVDEPARWLVWRLHVPLYTYLCDGCMMRERDETLYTLNPIKACRPIEDAILESSQHIRDTIEGEPKSMDEVLFGHDYRVRMEGGDFYKDGDLVKAEYKEHTELEEYDETK